MGVGGCARDWGRYVGVVRKLKASDYVGSDLLDKLATSERTVRG